MEDHLNYYLNTPSSRPRTSDVLGDAVSVLQKEKEEAMNAYFADKANIFKFQEESGVLVTTPEVFQRAKNFTRVDLVIAGEIVLVDVSMFPEDAHLATLGEHNRLNAALATEALKALSLTEEEIFEALASFPGVEGRLQFLRDYNGTKIYNDNNATTPQATIEGLKAVGDKEKKNVILLAGGSDKNIDLSPLVEMINKYCKAVILLSGTGTEKLVSQLQHAEVYENLEDVVKAGLAVGEPGDVLLFSPAFASFGLFKNEYDRNDQFVNLINQL